MQIGVLFKLSWWDAFLGHERFMETGLAGLQYMYGAMFLASWVSEIPVFRSLKAIGVTPLPLSIAFFVAGTLIAVGLALNVGGLQFSKWPRAIGAFLTGSLWGFILACSWSYYGHPLSPIAPCCALFIVSSAWIIRRSFMGLPRPGAMGQV